jgi:hypothetical protein
MRTVNVVLIIDGVVRQLFAFGENQVKEAETAFVALCKEQAPSEVSTEEDIEAALDNGYVDLSGSHLGSVCLTWSEERELSYTSDDKDF